MSQEPHIQLHENQSFNPSSMVQSQDEKQGGYNTNTNKNTITENNLIQLKSLEDQDNPVDGLKLNKIRYQQHLISQEQKQVNARINFLKYDEKRVKNQIKKQKKEVDILYNNKVNWESELKKRELFHFLKFKDLKEKQENALKIKQELQEKRQRSIQSKTIKIKQEARAVRAQSTQISRILRDHKDFIWSYRNQNVQQQIARDKQVHQRKELLKEQNLVNCKKNYEDRVKQADKTLFKKEVKLNNLLEKEQFLKKKRHTTQGQEMTVQNRLNNMVCQIQDAREQRAITSGNVKKQQESPKIKKERLYYGYPKEKINLWKSESFQRKKEIELRSEMNKQQQPLSLTSPFRTGRSGTGGGKKIKPFATSVKGAEYNPAFEKILQQEGGGF